jgi:hypothetical protein
MNCEVKKLGGWVWSMYYEYSNPVMVPCIYPAKYHIVTTSKSGHIEKMYTCGVHKNSIERQCNRVGIKCEVRHLTTNAGDLAEAGRATGAADETPSA